VEAVETARETLARAIIEGGNDNPQVRRRT